MTQRIIKRYKNRKLYDTKAGGYVVLSDIAKLVRTGNTVQIVDNETGEDLTAATLTQIILEEGKQGNHLLPTDFLHDLLRKSSESFDEGVKQVKQRVDDFVQGSLETINQFLPSKPKEAELEQLRTQLNKLETMLGHLLDKDKNQDRASTSK